MSENISALKEKDIRPFLSVILVGNNPASAVYVASKCRQAKEMGVTSFLLHLKEDICESDLLKEIKTLNNDPSVHGILIQMPLPSSLNPQTIIQAIDPQKDVDGLHPLNLGKLITGDKSGFIPCTPKGCLTLLKSYLPTLKGLHAAIVGRSLLVGKPLSLLLLQENCTVSVLHSASQDPHFVTQTADIVIAATGSWGLIKGDWIRKGAIILDVGITRGPDGLIHGDVDVESVMEKAGALSPVPGGVGPMTVFSLLENTVLAARRQTKERIIPTPL